MNERIFLVYFFVCMMNFIGIHISHGIYHFFFGIIFCRWMEFLMGFRENFEVLKIFHIKNKTKLKRAFHENVHLFYICIAFYQRHCHHKHRNTSYKLRNRMRYIFLSCDQFTFTFEGRNTVLGQRKQVEAA